MARFRRPFLVSPHGRSVTGAQRQAIVEADDKKLEVEADADAVTHGELLRKGAGRELAAQARLVFVDEPDVASVEEDGR